MPIITSLAWVPRGKAKQHPAKYNLTPAELERVSQLASVQLDDARMEYAAAQELAEADQAAADSEAEWQDTSDDDEENALKSTATSSEADQDGDAQMQEVGAIAQAQAAAARIKKSAQASRTNPDDLSIYNLDDYDNETSRGAAMGAFSNIRGLQYFRDENDDPYVTLKPEEKDEDDEREELEIYPTDNVIVAARTEDEVSQLDIYVYDELQSNLYVHHDLLLPAMPLCLEWLDYVPPSRLAAMEDQSPEQKGSFVAVGTLDPEIEIWSLDMIDGLYPDAILGKPKGDAPTTSLEAITSSIGPLSIDDPPASDGNSTKKKKKKKKPKAAAVQGPSTSYHTDAVLCLAWNKAHRSLLASSSADNTIKLWDLSLASNSPAIRSFDLHSDKVQALQWCPAQPTALLSGSWDATLKVFDTRSPTEAVSTKVPSDVECVKWNPWNQSEFLVGLENGEVRLYDYRNFTQPGSTAKPKNDKALWTLAAHDKGVSALDYSDKIPGFLVTGGTDKIVKLWNCAEDSQPDKQAKISLVASRDLGVGNVFSASFCPDDPTTLAVAGSQGHLQIWDCAANSGVRRIFEKRLKAAGKDVNGSAVKDNGGLLGVDRDSDGDETEEE